MTNAATLPPVSADQQETQATPSFWQRLLHYFAEQTEASSKSDSKPFEGLL